LAGNGGSRWLVHRRTRRGDTLSDRLNGRSFAHSIAKFDWEHKGFPSTHRQNIYRTC
jgi:hypothetical protein